MSATLLAGFARTDVPQLALRRFLALDSVVTTGNGLAYVAFSAPLGRLLGVGQELLPALGVLLVLYGAGGGGGGGPAGGGGRRGGARPRV
ncbi:hypothetical protein ACFW9B_16245, partial [Streptomyces yangpuensis]